MRKVRRNIAAIIRKKKRRDNFVDRLITKGIVVDMEGKLKHSLRYLVGDAAPKIAKRMAEEFGKVSDVYTRVNQVITDEYGSLADFISQSDMTDFLTGVYNLGGQQVLDSIGIDATFGVTNPTVLAQLANRSNFIIKSVDDTVKEELAQTFTNAYNNGESWQDIGDSIASSYPDIADYRAEMIARTETTNAVGQSNLDFYQESGLTNKEWMLGDSDACETCQDNSDAGLIALDDVFPDGSDAPPSHPNCRCVLNTTIPDDFIENNRYWSGE